MPKLEWIQPDKNEHVYLAVAEHGNYMVANVGPARWSATFEGDSIGEEESMSRIEAMTLCDQHANPKSLPLELNEYLVLKYLREAKDQTLQVGFVMNADIIPGTTSSIVMNVINSMAKRGIIRVKEDNITPTEVGEMSFTNFKPKDTTTTRKGRARRSGARAKFGDRPKDVGPPPTVVEFLEVQLANRQASLAYAICCRRIHPYSDPAAYKVKIAEEKVAESKDKLRKAQEAERLAEMMGLPVPLQK